MAEDDVPLLRADATDDQGELEPEIRVPARDFAAGGFVSGPKDPGDDSVPIILDNGYILPKGSIPDSEDAPGGEDDTVDPATPGATGSNGVIHGGR
jgi:hypothetical protein